MRNISYITIVMRKHNGMRPQDIAILLKIIALEKSNWQIIELANSLFISISEISESLNRSRTGGLIDYNKKLINRQSLFEFLIHGVKYVFPAQMNSLGRGIPTAYSHPFMQQYFQGDTPYIWGDPRGNMLGISLEPFYPKQVEAAKKDIVFYKLLALVDVIRIGRIREQNVAIKELEKMILHANPSN